MAEQNKLFEALSKAQGTIVAAGKSGENKFDHYKYATLEDYWASVQKPMSDNGLSFPVSVTKIERLPDRNTAKGGIERVVQVELTGHLCHQSGESMTFVCYGEGQDRSDKAIYKAVTGGKKYLLASVFNIPTTDDCENDSDAERGDPMDQRLPADRRPAATGRPAAQQQPTPQAGLTARTPAAAAELAQRSGAQQTPSNASRRPVAGKGTRKPPTPSANPLPPPKAGHDDLPYTMDEPQNPDGFVPPPLPEENVLIGKSPYDRIVIGIKLKKIRVDKWRKWLMEEYKTDSAQGLSEEQQNAIVDVIYNHPELIDPGMGF